MSPAPTSVVILNSHCHPQGGASRVAIDEATELAKLGLRIYFIGAVGPISDELSSPSITVNCLNQAELGRMDGRPATILQAMWNLKAYKTVGMLLETLDPKETVVHLHTFTQALSTSAVRAAIDRKFPIVVTMHDFFLACPNGAFFNYTTSQPCELAALSFKCISTNCDKRHYAHKIYRVVQSTVQRSIGGTPTKLRDFIALSETSGQILKPYFSPESRIHSLSNPIGISRAKRVDVSSNSNAVFVGRLDAEKGVESLIAAARTTDVNITFVGDGPFRNLAEINGHKVTGWLPRNAVLSELERARCLVFPSLWYETFGLVVDEAAARGIPSIVSGVSAASERVVNGVTGWQAKSDDVADLARCLRLTQNDELIDKTGRNAYDRWWASPSTLTTHAAKLLQIYQGMLRSRGD